MTVGDKVKYKPEFLWGIYAITKPEYNDHGVILHIAHGVATVLWNHGAKARIHVNNLEVVLVVNQDAKNEKKALVKRNFKGGRTVAFPGSRINPAVLAKLRLMLDGSGESIADWIEKHVEEDYIQWIKNA